MLLYYLWPVLAVLEFIRIKFMLWNIEMSFIDVWNVENALHCGSGVYS